MTYNYPGKYLSGATKPDTTEIYAALSWKWLSAKYSHSTTNLFGTPKSSGSGYVDVTGTFDLGDGWGVVAHGGHQSVKGTSAGDYSDWKLGATKDVGIGTVGLSFLGTNAKDSCSGAGQYYCFGGYSAGKSRGLLTFGKTL